MSSNAINGPSNNQVLILAAMSSQPAPAPVPQASNQGQVVRGGARGALLGAVGGAIGGDAGKGAKIGAGVGATAGLLKRRRGRIEQDAQQQAASAGPATKSGGSSRWLRQSL